LVQGDIAAGDVQLKDGRLGVDETEVVRWELLSE